LVWALLLLTLIIYVFAVVIVQLLDEDLAKLKANVKFTSFLGLMQALFMSISGGVDWSDVSEPMEELNPVLAPLFCLYVSFCVFCVLNIVTGVFVDQAHRSTQEDDENLLMEEIESRRKWMKDIKAVFEESDKDGDGKMSYEEFKESHKDLRVQTAMKHLGVDLTKVDASKVWELLDFENTGEVDVDSFVAGLQHMHGDAKAIDVARLMHELKATRKMVIEEVRELARMEDKIDGLSSQNWANLRQVSPREAEAVQERYSVADIGPAPNAAQHLFVNEQSCPSESGTSYYSGTDGAPPGWWDVP